MEVAGGGGDDVEGGERSVVCGQVADLERQTARAIGRPHCLTPDRHVDRAGPRQRESVRRPTLVGRWCRPTHELAQVSL